MTDPVLTLIDGEPSGTVSVSDRGLAYGDGVFETIRIANGQPLLLDAHLERLITGARRLSMPSDDIADLIQRDIRLADISSRHTAVLKIMLTRGSGGRGYRPDIAPQLRRILTLHDYYPSLVAAREGVRAVFCQTPLGINPRLARIKHMNRLEQVLASAELAVANDAFEGLMCDTEGYVVEGTRSNVFIAVDGMLQTPLIDRAGVEGVMRNFIMSIMPVTEVRLTPDQLRSADEVFLCNSVFGVCPVNDLDGGLLGVGPIARAVQRQISAQLGLTA